VYPSGARANQPPAVPPIQDYNLLEECPTQPGIHPALTWVAASGLTARLSIASDRSQIAATDCHPDANPDVVDIAGESVSVTTTMMMIPVFPNAR